MAWEKATVGEPKDLCADEVGLCFPGTSRSRLGRFILGILRFGLSCQ